MRVALHTLGCKLNQAETSTIASAFRAEGFEVVRLTDAASVVVINTCSVTKTADKECRQVIRRALRANPDAYVIVTGCYAQVRPEEVASIDGVDLVLGTALRHRVLELADGFRKRQTPRIEVLELDEPLFGAAFSHLADGRFRAFLKVQDGCDYNCSYCIVPRARGPSRSQSLEESVAQARGLIAQGFQEIVLTGVNLGEYRPAEDLRLVDLVSAIEQLPGLARLKLSSIEPNLLSDELIDLAASSNRLMPHFHIPMQSGSDRVLRAMRRRYRRDQYAQRVMRLVERIPQAGIGADVIVGFPGETNDLFDETASFVESLPVTYLHVFSYSERPGTPAADLPHPVTRRERKRRTQHLRSLSVAKMQAFVESQRDTERAVLFEKVLPDGRLTGLTDNYIRVIVEAPHALVGEIAAVRVERWQTDHAEGVLRSVR